MNLEAINKGFNHSFSSRVSKVKRKVEVGEKWEKWEKKGRIRGDITDERIRLSRVFQVALHVDGHCFIDKQTKEEYRVDFFNMNAWDEHHL
jgi:hypothetical protein